jgi:glucosamine--fructose-6-phosphate aminotransferase (isomerizing)
MAAIKLAKENGAFVFGVCNVVGSSISRETHAGAYTRWSRNWCSIYQSYNTNHCFNNDRTSLSKSKGTLSHSDFHMYLQELDLIPEKVKEALETSDLTKAATLKTH